MLILLISQEQTETCRVALEWLLSGITTQRRYLKPCTGGVENVLSEYLQRIKLTLTTVRVC